MNIHNGLQSLVATEEPWFANVVDRLAVGYGILCHNDRDDVRPGSLVHRLKQHFLLCTTQPVQQRTFHSLLE